MKFRVLRELSEVPRKMKNPGRACWVMKYEISGQRGRLDEGDTAYGFDAACVRKEYAAAKLSRALPHSPKVDEHSVSLG